MELDLMIAAPGYLYAAAFSLAAVMLSTTNPPRGPLWWRILVWSGLSLLSLYFFQITDNRPDSLYFLFLGTALAISALILLLSCEMPFSNVLYFTFHAFIIGEFTTAFSWQIVLFSRKHGFLLGGIRHVGLTCLFLEALVLTLFGLYIRRFRADHAILLVDRQTLWTVALTTCGIFLFSNISDVSRDTPFSGETAFQINLIRLLVDAGGIILLEAIRTERAALRKASEAERMNQLMQLQFENFRTSERSMALINHKYHDLKHQLIFLKSAATEKEQQKALTQMEDEIRIFEALANTGNHIMDTILTDKMLQCQMQNIRMTCMADGHLLDFVSAVDLAALLGNLLDNAIEYVSEIQDMDQRWIELTLRKKEHFVILEVRNSFQGIQQFEQGLPITTKGDDGYHGYGTKSVQATAARYGGAAWFTAENGCFTAKISFMEPR